MIVLSTDVNIIDRRRGREGGRGDTHSFSLRFLVMQSWDSVLHSEVGECVRVPMALSGSVNCRLVRSCGVMYSSESEFSFIHSFIGGSFW
mgnify:FL=1